MKFGKIFLFVLLSVLSISISEGFSKSKKGNTADLPDSLAEKQKIYIANIDYGEKAKMMNDGKVEAAVNLASRMSGKFTLVNFQQRDSIIKVLKSNNQKTTAAAVAKELDADRIYFLRVNVLENMLRVDISSTNLKNTKKAKNGVGYSLINFWEKATEERLYDPSLLKAVQRAMADVEGDSLMFEKAEGPFKVYPAPTLVIGGIDFQNTDKLPDWSLYEKKTANSYDANEVMFETARNCPYFIVYDNASRDSIYALFNMHIVENYRPPTSHEMEALSKLEVDYYITGFMNRTEDGAKVELYLCRIKNKSLNMLRQESGIIPKDDIEEMRKTIKEVTKKLLKLE